MGTQFIFGPPTNSWQPEKGLTQAVLESLHDHRHQLQKISIPCCKWCIEYYNWTRADVIGLQSASLSTPVVTSTSTATATSGTSLTNSSDCSREGTSPKTVGLGVGLGMGLPLLAAATFFAILWRLERRRGALVKAPAAATGSSEDIGLGRWDEGRNDKGRSMSWEGGRRCWRWRGAVDSDICMLQS